MYYWLIMHIILQAMQRMKSCRSVENSTFPKKCAMRIRKTSRKEEPQLSFGMAGVSWKE